MLKRGYHQIVHKVLEKAKDWVAIFDLTIDVGALKCLLILGVQFSPLKARGDLCLAHNDVQVLGIYFTTISTGEFVYQSLKNAEKKVGHPFKFLLLDQGSDVTKGANIYQKDSKKTVVVHDISHKIANVLEKKLKNDPHWKEFCEHITSTKLSVQQTSDLAALMPPKLRSQARYMSADVLMNWVIRFQESKKLGNMSSVSPERLNEYFGWLSAFEPHLYSWKQMITIGENSGALAEMLLNVAETYQFKLDHTLDNFTQMLEPLLMILIALFVGGLIIAMYLPIFRLGKII